MAEQPSPLVLASGSPRRRALLAQVGIEVVVRPTDVDESGRPGETPAAYVRRMAEAKLRAGLEAAADAAAGPFVLAADTVVVVEGRVLGKPADDGEARATLERLSGRAHEVTTAVALGRGSASLENQAVTTRVVFRALTAGEIDRYVATGEGRDKAGSYGVQGVAAGFVERLEGSWSNVVGLPLARTLAMLRAHGAVGAWP